MMGSFRFAVLTALLVSCAAGPPPEEGERVYFPDPPAVPRILFLRSVTRATDVQPPETSGLDQLLFGGDVEPPKPVELPCDIALRDGIFYVTDTRLGGIYAIDFAQQKMDLLQPEGRARLPSPMGLCFAPDGTAYVADPARRQVVVLTPDFKYQAEFGPWGDQDTSRPTDVAIAGNRLYVADSKGRCVRVLNRADGEEIQVLGNPEVRDEALRGPTSLAVDEQGFVYVVDTIYQRIYVWNRAGEFVCHIGAPGDAPGYFGRPKDVACRRQKLWVIDGHFNKGQVLALDGSFLIDFGKPGNEPGDLYLPRKIWVGTEGLELFRDRIPEDFAAEELIVVTNAYGNKISFYALGKAAMFEYLDPPLPERPTPKADDADDADKADSPAGR